MLTDNCNQLTIFGRGKQAVRQVKQMRFGDKIRELRQQHEMSQRDLAAVVDVTFTYISKIENHKLDFGEYPSDVMICKLAAALDADQDTLLILAEKIPPLIKQRVIERPEVFRRFAQLDDKALDELVEEAENKNGRRGRRPR